MIDQPLLIVPGQGRYTTRPGLDMSITQSIDGLEITAKEDGQKVWRPINTCPTCHRFNIEVVVLRSWQEAIDAGWLIPVHSDKETT